MMLKLKNNLDEVRIADNVTLTKAVPVGYTGTYTMSTIKIDTQD